MRKRQFTPTVDGRLEDRVVLSTVARGIDCLVVPTVRSRDVARVQARIDAAFTRAANDFHEAYKTAIKMNGANRGWALARLQQVGVKLGNRLGNELAAAADGLPYARRDLSPVLKDIGQSLGRELASFNTFVEMRTSGRSTFAPHWTAARDFVNDAIRVGVSTGQYTYRR